ncbi:MAG: ribose-5-phosphate isomerase [Actinomycetaceae bacterium]|nr:ribose-5-phosphate isomerase [Actinomycetaceae bacterium]
MRIHMGTDHAGFEYKEEMKKRLIAEGYDVVDHGALEYDPRDDYPEPCIACALAVAEEEAEGSLGIVIGGSGNGEQIAANKVRGIRAILAWNNETAVLGREHNNANVISVGARQHSIDEAYSLVKAFIETTFTQDERHVRRIGKIQDYEKK